MDADESEYFSFFAFLPTVLLLDITTLVEYTIFIAYCSIQYLSSIFNSFSIPFISLKVDVKNWKQSTFYAAFFSSQHT